ncbi:MAG TPA: aspartate dehydrogenase [Micromonospora sp.]|nr:aspartate dehydrogenase [Micromonospora sp.]
MTIAVERRVAIAGLGAVGRTLATALDEGIPGYRLTAVSVRRPERSEPFFATLRQRPAVVPVEELAESADIVIECAPTAIFAQLATPLIRDGKELIVLSGGALLEHWDLVDQAAETGAIIRVPSGALMALDAVQAAAQGEIHSVQMRTRKPLEGLQGAPFLAEAGIDLAQVQEPTRLFAGTARQAAKGFPANLNVAVALSLAGIGPDRTMLEVWADPTVTRNTHRIEVDSDSAKLTFTIENIPTENAKTGRITALSVIALLRKMVSPLQIGT